MKNFFSQKRAIATAVVFAALLMPLTAAAGIGDIISLLTTITGTLRSEVGQVLSEIQAIHATVANLEQKIVWPLALINQTKASVNQMRSEFSSLAGEIRGIQINSATLANPSRFETILRSAQTSNLNQIGASYRQVYLPLPQSNQATPAQRNLIDADDAIALEALKTAVASDQASEQMLIVADGLEKEAAASAPGSAGLLSAQALVANLQSQALLQKMLAADLRQQVAKLAHANALKKQSAEATKNLRTNMRQILNRH